MTNPLYREGNGGIPIPAGLDAQERHTDAEPSAAWEIMSEGGLPQVGLSTTRHWFSWSPSVSSFGIDTPTEELQRQAEIICGALNKDGTARSPQQPRETPEKPTQERHTGSEPSAGAILKTLSDAADEINGEIDRQIYDERAHDGFETAPGDEFTVTLKWGDIFAMDRAICAAQVLLRAAPASPESEPTGVWRNLESLTVGGGGKDDMASVARGDMTPDGASESPSPSEKGAR